MSRRKQSKPNRLQDEEEDAHVGPVLADQDDGHEDGVGGQLVDGDVGEEEEEEEGKSSVNGEYQKNYDDQW